MAHTHDHPDPAEGSVTGAELLKLLEGRGPVITLEELDELEVTRAEQNAQLPEDKWTSLDGAAAG